MYDRKPKNHSFFQIGNCKDAHKFFHLCAIKAFDGDNGVKIMTNEGLKDHRIPRTDTIFTSYEATTNRLLCFGIEIRQLKPLD
jgi:hypothetical protein